MKKRRKKGDPGREKPSGKGGFGGDPTPAPLPRLERPNKPSPMPMSPKKSPAYPKPDKGPQMLKPDWQKELEKQSKEKKKNKFMSGRGNLA